MDAFYTDAQQIFDVARIASENVASENQPTGAFIVVVRPDGGLHFFMDGAVSLEGTAALTATKSAYLVTRSARGVKVEGRNFAKTCVLEDKSPNPVTPYWMTSPVRIASLDPPVDDVAGKSSVSAAIRLA